MAHKEAQDTFNRHFPLWYELGHDMLIACPEREAVALTELRRPAVQITCLQVGKKEHTGIHSIVRFKTILEQMNGQGYDRYGFFEYDALCLGALPTGMGDIAGNVFRDNSPNRGFVGTSFVHPPLIFTAHGLNKIVGEMQGMALSDEKSTWDRWFGLCTERLGMPVYDLLQNGLGYSMNTITPDKHEELFKVIREGCLLVHGVKTPECLDVILQAKALRASINHVKEYGGKVAF